MLGRKNTILASTALVAGLAVAACNGSNNPPLTPLEDPPVFGAFGLEVGVPINLISASRGDGVSTDKFAVTFNNEDGTDITITTPEGESINFSADDPDSWIGMDPRMNPDQLARVFSARGDVLEVFLGEASDVPVLNDDGTVEDFDSEVVFAVARLDEQDTSDGFETYAVVGALTDPADLPRYQTDQLDGDGAVIPDKVAGNLVQGTAQYVGLFNATVFQGGNVLSDGVSGDAYIELDFAAAAGTAVGDAVRVEMDGSYQYDDPLTDDNTTQSNIFDVHLDGIGSTTEISFANGTVFYTGALKGTVDIPDGTDDGSPWDVGGVVDEGTPDEVRYGEFAGAVYGPGAAAFEGAVQSPIADPPVAYTPSSTEIIDATATAGVFAAGSQLDLRHVAGFDPTVEIVGAFGAESDGFCNECSN